MRGNDLSVYGPRVAGVLGEPRVMGLGPGASSGAMRGLLQDIAPENLFPGKTVRDVEMARACIAGLWLYHDFFDESHAISQGIETPTGSYWHGILHRREPDYDNAKYWFRRVGRHPVYDSLKAEAATLGHGETWDPFKFVDACESASRAGGAAEQTCREIQMKEWWALFDYCFRQAAV